MRATGHNPGTSGAALLEALVALAIVGATLVALIYMQMRSLADTEHALRQTQVLHLIDDLAERIRSHPGASGDLDALQAAWGPPPAPEADCATQWCGPAQLARWDLAQWKRGMARALPGGDATVFAAPGNRRMLGVMVAWRSRLGESFMISVPGATCPADHACQFGHVQP